jgi:hypothetical protein
MLPGGATAKLWAWQWTLIEMLCSAIDIRITGAKCGVIQL